MNNKLFFSLIFSCSALFLSVLGIYNGQSPIKLGALPMYNIFQILPVGQQYGLVMSSGISTSTLIASTSPTFSSFTATSTTATSTFRGSVEAARICLTESATCLGSTGGNFVSSINSTSSDSNNNIGGVQPYITAALSTSQKLAVWASCGTTLNSAAVFAYLDIGNPGGGTTTLATTRKQTTAADLNLFGVYTSTTTGTVKIAIDQDDTPRQIMSTCFSPRIMYIIFSS